MRKSKKIVALVISLVFLTGIFPVYADEIDDVKNRLDNVNTQIGIQRGKVNDAKKREKTIMGQIQNLEQNIDATEKEIESINARISYLEESIRNVEKDIAESEKQLNDQTDMLSDRLVFIYEQGDVSYLEVMLSATDIRDFLTRYDMVKCIVDQDIELIESINKQKKELNIKKCDLEVKKKELVNVRKSQESKKQELDAQRGQKKEILGSVKQEKTAYLKALQELEQASQQLEQIIRNAQSGGKQLGTGTYTWPTPGYTNITSSYGMRFHPILKQRKLHTGVDIGAPMSATIVAADSGTVIHAGWMNGYGKVLIVDHGNNLSTLYAHQSAFLVSKGSAVNKGQPIGKVGSTGWSTGPHLHFEVRINGKCTDPMPYIR